MSKLRNSNEDSFFRKLRRSKGTHQEHVHIETSMNKNKKAVLELVNWRQCASTSSGLKTFSTIGDQLSCLISL